MKQLLIVKDKELKSKLLTLKSTRTAPASTMYALNYPAFLEL